MAAVGQSSLFTLLTKAERSTGRQEGSEAILHGCIVCLSEGRPGISNQTPLWENENEQKRKLRETGTTLWKLSNIKITKTYGPGPRITCTLLYYSAHPWKPKQITQHIFMYCAICRLAQRCQMANITLVKTHIYKVIFNFSFLNLSEGWKKHSTFKKNKTFFGNYVMLKALQGLCKSNVSVIWLSKACEFFTLVISMSPFGFLYWYTFM